MKIKLSNGTEKEFKLEKGNYFFKSFVGGNWIQINNKKYITELKEVLKW